ncbi:MAG: MCE family protein [Chitinophagales bacterium]|nr:MCE family protein [Chitinophagales bacterium]
MTRKATFPFLLALLLTTWSCNQKKTYELEVIFDNVNGLYENSTVKLSGLDVGKVKSLKINDEKPLVTVEINNDVKISNNAIFEIRNQDYLGTKFINIRPSHRTSRPLENGDTITGYYTHDEPTIFSDISSVQNADTAILLIVRPILDSLGYEIVRKKQTR